MVSTVCNIPRPSGPFLSRSSTTYGRQRRAEMHTQSLYPSGKQGYEATGLFVNVHGKRSKPFLMYPNLHRPDCKRSGITILPPADICPHICSGGFPGQARRMQPGVLRKKSPAIRPGTHAIAVSIPEKKLICLYSFFLQSGLPQAVPQTEAPCQSTSESGWYLRFWGNSLPVYPAASALPHRS